MKPLILLIAILTLVALACSAGATPTPIDIHPAETSAAGTMTALAPTEAPRPTLMPTPTRIPTVSFFPTLSRAPIRIQFEKGAISATVSSTVTFPSRVDYVLQAVVGQKMTVSLSSTGNLANFIVFGSRDKRQLKLIDDESRIWEGGLPASQDYVVSVGVPYDSDVFTLVITITGP